jgi:hypothetical protein
MPGVINTVYTPFALQYNVTSEAYLLLLSETNFGRGLSLKASFRMFVSRA